MHERERGAGCIQGHICLPNALNGDDVTRLSVHVPKRAYKSVSIVGPSS